jgi:hypothetical protein
MKVVARRLFLLLLALTLYNGAIPTIAQSPQCSKKCVSTVRGLLKAQQDGVSLSWLEKENRTMGDSVAVGIQKIYTKNRLLASENIKLFLPVILEAFQDTEMIIRAENKKPAVTLPLLNRLKARVKDSLLRKKIDDAIMSIVDLTK